MSTTITITRQWQIHIPKHLREKLGLKRPGQAQAEVKGKSLIISPKKSKVVKLANSIKVKNPIPAEKIRDYIDYSNL